MISPETAHPRPRIMIVDDDSFYLRMLTSFLRDSYDVTTATDGEEGYHKALACTPDAMFLDVMMPGWDGLKTLKAIRSHPALAQMPVIMLSSDASQTTVLAAIYAGATDYLLKSGFSKDEYLEKLEVVLQLSAHPIQSSARNEPDVSGAGAGNYSSCEMEARTREMPADIQEMLDAWD